MKCNRLYIILTALVIAVVGLSCHSVKQSSSSAAASAHEEYQQQQFVDSTFFDSIRSNLNITLEDIEIVATPADSNVFDSAVGLPTKPYIYRIKIAKANINKDENIINQGTLKVKANTTLVADRDTSFTSATSSDVTAIASPRIWGDIIHLIIALIVGYILYYLYKNK